MSNFQLQVGQQNSRSNKETENWNNTIDQPSRHMTEKAMAPHSSTLAWKMLWTEEPGRMQSMGPQRVGHN